MRLMRPFIGIIFSLAGLALVGLVFDGAHAQRYVVVARVVRSTTDLQLNDKLDLHIVQRSRKSKMPDACSLCA
jgi:hypothetical protein